MGKTVVVLGGSLGGLAVTHRLLKYTQPHEEDLKVILVSKNSHFFWNTASVRAIVPNLIRDDQITAPIQPGLAQYPTGNVEFIIGTATAVDVSSRTVQVDTGADGMCVLTYDHLVLATGANAVDADLPWKAGGSYNELLSSIHRTAEQVGAAKHIIIAGAGSTGCEVAGEIRFAFPSTTVILVSSGSSLVGGDSIATSVERELGRLGVEIRKSVRVDEATPLPDGKTRVVLSDGQELTTDLYLPTTGLVPNTGFLPSEWLNEHRYVDVDDEMRVKGAENVWAVGDVVSKPRASVIYTEAQSAGVANNIDLVLKGEPIEYVKGPAVDTFLCAIGRSRGAGRIGPVPVPSLAVWAVKGRTLGIERTSKYADGSMW
ncbi:hypothetical protein EDB81DRAFT_877865 [Dactylonectria macrodidyma]|uniref:FAD/NAD(P)-binding domain-containing protein n=1 Tax=Dactylonectria macrodidyma TaxID=307937 RepID=A0A9P9JEY6_9HYPO|nr:hypothetical protein EDB81DRAFT_877865 [Dactylonectria macrodidyma]